MSKSKAIIADIDGMMILIRRAILDGDTKLATSLAKDLAHVAIVGLKDLKMNGIIY